MKPGKIAFVLISFLLSVQHSAKAESEAPVLHGPYCRPLKQLTAAAKNCYENKAFAKAAEACQKKYEQALASSKESLALLMKSNSEASGGAQDGSLANAVADLRKSESTLIALRASGEMIQKELRLYLESFVWPGFLYPREASQHSARFRDFLVGFPCYRENHDLVGAQLRRVEKNIAELEAAQLRTAQMLGEVSENLGKLKGESAPAPQWPQRKSTGNEITGLAP